MHNNRKNNNNSNNNNNNKTNNEGKNSAPQEIALMALSTPVSKSAGGGSKSAVTPELAFM